MYCVKCGTLNDTDSKYCRKCGAQFPSVSSGSPNLQCVDNEVQHMAAPSAGPKKHKFVIISIIAVLLIACAAAAGLIWMNTGQRLAEKQLSLGEKYLADSSYEEAIIAFNKVIEIDPKNAPAYLGLADAYMALGDNDKAIEALTIGVANNPQSQELLIKLADLHITLGDRAAAVKVLEDGYGRTNAAVIKQKLDVLDGKDASNEAADDSSSDTASGTDSQNIKWSISPSIECDEIRALYYRSDNGISKLASIKKDGKYGVINYEGKIIIPIENSSPPFFCIEGLICDDKIFDIDGNYIGEHYGHGGGGEQFLWDINNNKAAWFYGDGGDFEYLTSDLEDGAYVVEGVIVKQTDRGYIDSYEDVQTTGKFGVINGRRELVVPLMYDQIGDFSDGLAAAKKDGKWGYIDEKGNTVVPFIYEDTIVTEYYSAAYGFSGGYAAVKRDGKWGYIDSTAEEVIPCTLDGAEPICNGKGWAKQNGLWGVIEL